MSYKENSMPNLKCQQCNKDAHDNSIPHELWNKISKHTGKDTLCTKCIKKAIREIVKKETELK